MIAEMLDSRVVDQSAVVQTLQKMKETPQDKWGTRLSALVRETQRIFRPLRTL
jgi:hypothetical protein